MLPEPLPFGHYEILEQCTAYGYVLSSEPVPFTVDGTQTTITVEKHNIAQKGQILVRKTGEVFSSVTETDGIYQPVYAVTGLRGLSMRCMPTWISPPRTARSAPRRANGSAR